MANELTVTGPQCSDPTPWMELAHPRIDSVPHLMIDPARRQAQRGGGGSGHGPERSGCTSPHS